MAISHQHTPPNGWRYFEEKTKTTLVAGTRDKLGIHLENHRQSNGIEQGDVQGDIDRQIEELHPHLKI